MSKIQFVPVLFLITFLSGCNLGQQSPQLTNTPEISITLTSSNVGIPTTVPNTSEAALNPTAIPATEATCTPRSEWPTYTIQAGDNLTAIAARTNSTIDELVAANCLENANNIRRGQDLFVPNDPSGNASSDPTQVTASGDTIVLDLGIGLVLNYPSEWNYQPFADSQTVGGIIRNFPPENEPPLAAAWPAKFVSVVIVQIEDEFASDDMETWVNQVAEGTNNSECCRVTGGPFSQALSSGLQTVRLDVAGGGPPSQNYFFIIGNGANITIGVNGISPQLAENVINSIRPSG